MTCRGEDHHMCAVLKSAGLLYRHVPSDGAPTRQNADLKVAKRMRFVELRRQAPLCVSLPILRTEVPDIAPPARIDARSSLWGTKLR